MKLKDLKINKQAHNILYDKLKDIKIPNIPLELNKYEINYYNLKMKLEQNTRYNLLKDKFNIKEEVEDFNKNWNENVFKMEKYFSYLRKLEKYSGINLILYQKLILSYFISQNVINDIINRTKKYATVIGNKRNILIFGNSKQEIDLYIHKTLSALNFFNFFHKNDNDLNLYIFLNDTKKSIPKDNYFTSEHVNTGYSVKGKYVCIFRKEEFEKVLFHELIHFYNLDIQEYSSFIKKNIPVKFMFNPNEAFTDFFAIILQILYISSVSNKKLKDLIYVELGYINSNVKKIMNVPKYNEIEDFLKMDNFNQSTSVFSYYIFKSALFNNIDLLKSMDLFDFKMNYDLLPQSFFNKKWIELLSEIKYIVSSSSLKMSYISRYL